jgi:hypothetical protein
MPLPERTKRITLEDIGSPELFVVFKRTSGMPYGDFLDVFGDDVEGEDSDAKQLTGREIVEKRFAGLIVDWNIPHDHTVCGASCTDPELALVLPSQEPSVVFSVPRLFADFISDAMLKDSIEERESFLVSRTKSDPDWMGSLSNTEAEEETNKSLIGFLKSTLRKDSVQRRGT